MNCCDCSPSCSSKNYWSSDSNEVSYLQLNSVSLVCYDYKSSLYLINRTIEFSSLACYFWYIQTIRPMTNVKFNNNNHKHLSPYYIEEEECFDSSKTFADLVPNLKASSSCMDPVCRADSLKHNLCRENEPEQGTRPFTPHLELNLNLRGDHRVMDNLTSQPEAAQSSGQEMKRQSDSGEIMCKCRKPESQEAGTQTCSQPMAEMHDASTQCNLCHSPVDASPHTAARRGQCGTALQQGTYMTSMGEAGSSFESPWRKQKPRSIRVTSTNTMKTFPENNSDYKGVLQRPKNSPLNTLGDNKGKISHSI